MPQGRARCVSEHVTPTYLSPVQLLSEPLCQPAVKTPMAELYPSIAQCAIVATALKVLLFPAYKSTDFEVHRNWLALTHSLPIKEWYFEKTSEWTLDYPPFFAYFEWLMSQAAVYVDAGLLNVKDLGYDSWQTIYFQRTTVIITELVLVYALHLYVKTSKSKVTAHAAALSVLSSPGLLIIDHVHFQYNGFLYGILILSMVLARNSSTLLLSGLLFAALLCLKHIYLYLAPAYFVYLLRAYCLGQRSSFPYFNIQLFNCVKLGVGIITVFAVAFGPFALWGQLAQVISRLFPFSRGLCHAYWAPNVWALYSFADRLLIYLAPRLGLHVDPEAVNSVTRGLVGDTSFAVLPDVVPLTCFLLTLGAQIPVLLRLLYRPTWEAFIDAVTLCGYASFLFGWHVHEKAILLVIIPFSLIALQDRRYFGAFRPLAVAGHVSLFPLLFTAAEFPVKTVYTVFWLVLFLLTFDRLVPASPKPRIFLLDRFSLIYIALSIPLIAYCSLVLFKRKPVKLEPLPKNLDDSTEVWLIEQTGEVFTEYERYLERYDFYHQASNPVHHPFFMNRLLTASQPSFTCQATGHSGYTYFEAQESEVGSTSILVKADEEVTSVQTEASKEINSIFPDNLRSPVLHYAQFQDHHRMDDLVNDVYDHFKEQFTLRDRVYIEGDPRRFGVITEITDNSRLHSMFTGQSMDDNIRSYTYVITMEDSGETVTKYKASELHRDKKVYSKLILKAFLSNALQRESWVGALWMVKDSLAKRYDIPTKIPDHKTRQAVLDAKKTIGNIPNGVTPPVQQPYIQHAPNGQAPHMNGHRPPLPPSQGPPTFVNFSASGPPPYAQHMGPTPAFASVNGPPRPYIVNGQPLYNNGGPPPVQNFGPPFQTQQQIIGHLPPHLVTQFTQANGNGPPVNFPFQTSFPHQSGPRSSNQPQPQQAQAPPPPPPPRPVEYVKYPCEDLEIKQPRLQYNRPTLKFFSDNVPPGVEPPTDEKKTGILMKSIGPLLCVWETLNVHDTIYLLDSFTFDDFVDAIRFSHETVECELFVEMHCAILKQIVNGSGKIQAPLPNMADAEDSSEEDSSDESEPTPEPEPPVRTTRSSLRKSGAAQLVIRPRTPTPEPPKEIHNAAEFDNDFDWVEQCKLRNFPDGGWQAIVVGLLYRLSFDPARKEACDEILAQLAPPEEEATVASIAKNYIDLDVNLRISALEMILSLTVVTENFREQLVVAAQEMTRLRKEKIEYQRKRKELSDELYKLDLERKIHLVDNTPASPSDTKMTDDVDVSMNSINDESKDVADTEANDGNDAATSKTRTRPSNKNKRKAAAEEARKEKAKKVKRQKDWEKLLTAIEKKKDELKDCEDNINELDDDLRETLVHRSKMLGKDRFLNKYYWFEHNGMPFGGVPQSSTAEYGYANGRIWVQGPSEYELGPNLEEPALSQDLQRFGYTIPQRKEREEGSTHLSNSQEWGYYDDPEDVEKLLAWLDERGLRERILRKELQAFRDRIVEYMLKMRKHLEESDQPEDEDDEEEDNKTRVSTRNKTYADRDVPKDRCLRWTNSIMRDEFGHNHVEEYEPPKKGKAKAVKGTKAKGCGR
ncbi:dolichyl pyrophosphate Glc1Man9 c2 alpha-13-glucosyltransferase [Pyrenophora seminiperda CCB06]|uniref:Dolichyl pyrophosphate Glc1Man9 c2 alpha-13-glucosyltransferase n=1 Tax=Pyrenophora seminiperda CCB06 TaxID=1302712 RepID=A0A3M7LXR9_9PLEO|nr:dolichyl pyrophosphate Glc1Man9 c2 alpha-13-glucosyltransferase [Pyrenophora seminiperda CCB06]